MEAAQTYKNICKLLRMTETKILWKNDVKVTSSEPILQGRSYFSYFF